MLHVRSGDVSGFTEARRRKAREQAVKTGTLTRTAMHLTGVVAAATDEITDEVNSTSKVSINKQAVVVVGAPTRSTMGDRGLTLSLTHTYVVRFGGSQIPSTNRGATVRDLAIKTEILWKPTSKLTRPSSRSSIITRFLIVLGISNPTNPTKSTNLNANPPLPSHSNRSKSPGVQRYWIPTHQHESEKALSCSTSHERHLRERIAVPSRIDSEGGRLQGRGRIWSPSGGSRQGSGGPHKRRGWGYVHRAADRCLPYSRREQSKARDRVEPAGAILSLPPYCKHRSGPAVSTPTPLTILQHTTPQPSTGPVPSLNTHSLNTQSTMINARLRVPSQQSHDTAPPLRS
jgi:hypothetical protein